MKQLSFIPLWCDHEWAKSSWIQKFIKVTGTKYYTLQVITKYKCKNCYTIKEIETEGD